MVQQPHPAVARIIAPEPDGTSYGTGSLIAVNDHYGLVITNWHVIRDATGQIWVVFPGGFQSPATIMKADRDWDLAALIVFKPNVDPLPVSTQAPLLGERLTIAGYGSGWYRAVSGRCVHYFSPGGDHPAEIVELSVPARNGDSGGPIFNDRGEVAGVLFGADSTSTMGSYCGRLRRFLAPLANDFARLPPPLYAPRPNAPSPIAPQPAMIAQQNPMRQEASPAANCGGGCSITNAGNRGFGPTDCRIQPGCIESCRFQRSRSEKSSVDRKPAGASSRAGRSKLAGNRFRKNRTAARLPEQSPPLNPRPTGRRRRRSRSVRAGRSMRRRRRSTN